MLVAGWFSFEEVVATVGDLLARDVACRWLDEAGLPHDVAIAPWLGGGVHWTRVDPADYSDLLFVCGPFGDRPLIGALLERFAHCRLLGLNLTMLEDHAARRFDVLFEREGERPRPDVSFAARTERLPVVGVALVLGQEEYEQTLHTQVRRAVERLVDGRELAVVDVDTNLLHGEGARVHTPAQWESLVARTDAVVTNRLHGLALALKNGVPAVAIDSLPGGAKVRCQAETIGWPAIFDADALDQRELERALDWCLTEEAREEALRCRARAEAGVAALREEFLRAAPSAPDREGAP